MSPAEFSRRPGLAYPYKALLLILVLLAFVSTAAGVRNALRQSQDFQWSGARLLDQHVDPWAVYLQGDPDHLLVASQIPNYLPILYVLIAPLGLLPMASAKIIWALSNVGFAVAGGWLSARFYGFRGKSSILVVSLFLMATATRVAIGNGQQSLLILCLWCLSLFCARLTPLGVQLSGLSYAKFSFSPPMFFYLLLRFGVRKTVFSLFPVAAGAVVTWLWLAMVHPETGLLEILREPFEVARTGFRGAGEDQDLVGVLQPLLGSAPEGARLPIALSVGFLVCACCSYFMFYLHRDSTPQWHLAMMATMSFSLFNHHCYDAVVLLLPLCYALRRWRERRARVVLLLLGYLFYLQRIVEAAHLHRNWMRVVEFGMLMTILAATYRLREPLEEVATGAEVEELEVAPAA